MAASRFQVVPSSGVVLHKSIRARTSRGIRHRPDPCTGTCLLQK